MIRFFYRISVPFIRKREGLTLLELTVVLVVTTALSGFLIVYNHASRQQIALSVEQAKLVQVISRAKSLSLSTYHRSSSEICGYGVHVDYSRMTYTLFSYAKPAGVECGKISNIDPALEDTVYSFSLNRDVLFVSSPSKGGIVIDDALFVPPDPTTLMSSRGALITNGFGSITLGTRNNSIEAAVSISSAGQISF